MTSEYDIQEGFALIITDNENRGFYHSLDLKGGRLEQYNFKDCIDHIARSNADVILLDCGCRVWTGLSVLCRIKDIQPGVPVIFLADVSSEEAAINAAKLGAYEYIKKPAENSELKRLLEVHLSAEYRASAASPSMPGLLAKVGGAPYLKSTQTEKPRNFLQVIAFIENNLWSSIELDGLAQIANLSKFHFCRVFKRRVGMNPMKFVNALRIERAEELLAKNAIPVSLVASEVGFRDLSNFVRQFKKMTGVTPTAYRDRTKSQNRAAPEFSVPQQ